MFGLVVLKTGRVKLFLLFIGILQFLTGCAMQVGSTKYRPFEDTLYTFKSSKEIIGYSMDIVNSNLTGKELVVFRNNAINDKGIVYSEKTDDLRLDLSFDSIHTIKGFQLNGIDVFAVYGSEEQCENKISFFTIKNNSIKSFKNELCGINYRYLYAGNKNKLYFYNSKQPNNEAIYISNSNEMFETSGKEILALAYPQKKKNRKLVQYKKEEKLKVYKHMSTIRADAGEKKKLQRESTVTKVNLLDQ